ncbi:FMN-binding negative transcriptional regulator [Sagittula salina]|uniref:FMN-binding negative transcriptional regulator n=1 Tax=Sagittula salina TaxID=2820268 RepID=A0A940RZR7_9RHOB|nr:FMN-binding negative transcriptional regulator [Sagittula salina]MBP0482268.1 FMN-binding negative transcriptional regulator [Sagittula salina]
MHPNPGFRKTARAEALAFARTRSFGILASSGADAPDLAHIPFLLNENGTEAQLHLARSNPIARACTGPLPVKLAVSGPDGYISPDWYAMEDQVPTWNYVAVHLTGTLHPLPLEALPEMLAAQSAGFETFLPKPPWTMDKLSEETLARLMRMIQPFRLDVTAVDSTYKLSQNKPDSARLSAARHVPDGFGTELRQLSDLMRTPPPEGPEKG